MFFKNPNDPELIENKKAISKWMQFYFKQDSNTSISILEIACTEQNCAHATTQITTNEKTFTIHKPLLFIRKNDIYELFKNENTHY